MNNYTVSLIGVCLDLGAEDLGTYDGPATLRTSGIINKLTNTGLQIEDLGDIPAAKRESLQINDPTLPFVDEIVRVNTELATHTKQQLESGRKVVVVGGDHSVNLGAFSGASVVFNADIGLIYIDAHGDMNTPESSLSHNIHGMHLASLMGFGPKSMTSILSESVKLPTDKLLHIASSDLDPFEKNLIREQNIIAVPMFDILTKGLSAVTEAIDRLKNRTSHIWVSLDLDAIDWVYAPAVGIPNQGGLTYREIALICEYIGATCPVVGLDLVEYNPSRDVNNKTAELSIELIAKLLGSDYSWYTNYMLRQQTK